MTFGSRGSSVQVSSTTFVHLSLPDSHIFTKYCCNSFYKCHLCTSHLYPAAPPPTGMGRDNDFHFPEPWCKPLATNGVFLNLCSYSSQRSTKKGVFSALCLTLHNRKSKQGKCPNVIAPTLPRHCGDNKKKYLSGTLPRLFHGYPRRWGPWIQMTGVLSSLNIV